MKQHCPPSTHSQVSRLIKDRKRVAVRVKHAELAMIHSYEELRVARETRGEEAALAEGAEALRRELREVEERIER